MISASGNASLKAAAAAGSTIYYKDWNQWNLRIPGAWNEQQKGSFYYDGSHTWVSKSYRGYKGWHVCDLGYGVGVTIDNISCEERAMDTRGVANWDYYKTCLGVGKVDACTSHAMHADAYNDGKLVFRNQG